MILCVCVSLSGEGGSIFFLFSPSLLTYEMKSSCIHINACTLTHINAHLHTHLSVASSLFRTIGTLQCLSDHLASALLDIVTAKGDQSAFSFLPFSLINGDNSDSLYWTKSSQRGNILKALWLTLITVDIYIIIIYVMCYCLLLVTQPADGPLCARALYLLTVADFLHLSHFVQVQETIAM